MNIKSEGVGGWVKMGTIDNFTDIGKYERPDNGQNYTAHTSQ